MYVCCTENEGSGGPTVLIFHETVHTDPLEDPTEILHQRLGSLNQVFPVVVLVDILGDPEVTGNIYCKSRNLPNTDMQKYSTDLR